LELTTPALAHAPAPPAAALASTGGAVKAPSDLFVRIRSAVGLIVLIPAFLHFTGSIGLASFLSVLQLVGTREISRLPGLNGASSPQTSLLFRASQISCYGVVLSQTMLKLLSNHYEWGLNTDILTLGLISTTLITLVTHLNGLPLLTPPLISSHLSSLSSLLISSLLIVPATSLCLDLVLKFGGEGWLLLLYSVTLAAVNDTMAYVGGKVFGRTKLLKVLSPNKTVEGFGTALLSTVVASHYLSPFFKLSDYSTNFKILCPLLASSIAPFGGFLASTIKRAYGVKDFGSFIPGHGGVVDRVDCLMVVVGIVWVMKGLEN